MYINCYHEDETQFEHHGEFKVFVGENDNNIYRALNGQCYATFKVKLDDPYVNFLKPRMIVKLPTPNKKNPMQLFRIVDYADDGNGIEFTAFPVLWDLATGFIPHLNSVAKTRLEASQYILDKAQETKPHRICVIEKEPHQDQKNLQIVRYNPLVALIGDKDNTIVNRYQTTEFDFDNFEFHLYNRLGEETEFVIRENKNMEDYNREIDYKPIATRIIPQGSNELLLPEYFVDSPDIDMYSEVYYKHVEFPDIGIDEENGITEEMAIELLREAAMKMFTENNIDKPVLSWTIKFDDGQDNPNVPDHIKKLLKLDLGDSVRVYKSGLSQMLESRIVEYNYNFVKRKYEDICISNKARSFTVSIDKTVADINMKVDSFVSVVSNATQDLYTKIEQTEKSIKLEVKDLKEGMESSITQLAGEIELRVEKDGIISSINQTAETIKIQASKIELSGYVTVDSLSGKGTTVIDGSNITTGIISSQNGNLQFNLNNGRMHLYDNNKLMSTIFNMRNNRINANGMGILTNSDSFIALGIDDNDDNTLYSPYIVLAGKDWGNIYKQGVNFLTRVNFDHNSVLNPQILFNGFKRNSGDYVTLYASGTSASESKLILELGNDFKTSFEINHHMYNKESADRVASFRAVGGSETDTWLSNGINLFQNVGMNNYCIRGAQEIQSKSFVTVKAVIEELSLQPQLACFNSTDIKYTATTCLQENVEFFATEKLADGYCKVELPIGFIHRGYIVNVSPHSTTGTYQIIKNDDYFEVVGDIEEFDYIVKGIM